VTGFTTALWAEVLKTWRSKVWLIVLAGFTILPLVAALFMVILKDPVAAKEMGIISMKAQLTVGTADWTSMFGILNMGTAIAGSILFAILTAWVFGSEFFNRTVKELLALPVSRGFIVAAKFTLVLGLCLSIGLYVFLLGLLMGAWVSIPGWSTALLWQSFGQFMLATLLTIMLMPVVAFFASAGRGYLAPLGWAFFGLASANIMAVLGWGEWYPWSVPVLLTEMLGPRTQGLGWGSYFAVSVSFLVGVTLTYTWWLRADQSR
jgi:ABC-2 type transport system permease protein